VVSSLAATAAAAVVAAVISAAEDFGRTRWMTMITCSSRSISLPLFHMKTHTVLKFECFFH